jgi:gamma-glutamylputrescine oxidase
VTRPLWVDPATRTFPTLSQDLTVDLAVVGGGFSGLGAARAASEHGATVVLLEERTIASGASGRNAGFVLAGPAMGFAASVRAIGLEQTLEVWRLTQENHAVIAGLVDDLDTDCGYLRRGSMSLAASDLEWADMEMECDQMTAAGLNTCRVPAQALPSPFDGMYCGGTYHAGNAEIDPGSFLMALALQLSPQVQIFETTPVQSLRHGDGVTLDTRLGTVRARRAVVATNAYTSTLMPDVPIASVRGQVSSTQSLGRVMVPCPMYADRGFQYWRQTADGRLVVGGWRNLAPDVEVGREEDLHREIQYALSRFVDRIAPDSRIECQWAGIMGFTPDHFPLVGSMPGRPGISIAAGYSGHGVAMAFICGSLAARAALGSPAWIPKAFAPGRFLVAA